MVRRSTPTPLDDVAEPAVVRAADASARDHGEAAVRDLPDLSSLPVAGLTRRRLAGIIGALLAAWIVIVFARQVGDAAAATARVEQMTADNSVRSKEVVALARELDQIRRDRFIEQQARGHGLGTSKEIAFTLAEDAPPLADDAPGSASVRLGARSAQVSPIERWMTLLFGPGD